MARLGELLVQSGALPPAGLAKALETQGLLQGRLGTNLIELGLAPESTILAAIAKQRNCRAVSATELSKIPPSVTRLLPEKVARRYRVVPFRIDNKELSIASLDPSDLLVEDEVGFLTSCRILTHVALEIRLFEALERYYGVARPRRLAAIAQRLARGDAGAPPVVVAPSAPPPRPSRPAPPAPVVPQPVGPAPFLGAGDELGEAGFEHFEERFATPGPPAKPSRTVDAIEITAEDQALFASLSSAAESLAPAPANDAGATAPAAAPAEAVEPEPVAEPSAVVPLEGTPEERLEIAARELQNAIMREDIGDVVLDFAAPYFERRLLIVSRKDRLVGWRGAGAGVDEHQVRELDLPGEEPSLFQGLRQGPGFWLGGLPPLPHNKTLVEKALGGKAPPDCLVVAITLRGKAVAFLYGDNGARTVGGSPLGELRRLIAKAGVAFEVYILKNKIRTL